MARRSWSGSGCSSGERVRRYSFAHGVNGHIIEVKGREVPESEVPMFTAAAVVVCFVFYFVAQAVLPEVGTEQVVAA